jgi:hypothetical protein
LRNLTTKDEAELMVVFTKIDELYLSKDVCTEWKQIDAAIQTELRNIKNFSTGQSKEAFTLGYCKVLERIILKG